MFTPSASHSVWSRPTGLHSMRFFFFNDTAPSEIYTLSLHDALPISFVNLLAVLDQNRGAPWSDLLGRIEVTRDVSPEDRKSTRLNSSHPSISYAVFCLKKKKD